MAGFVGVISGVGIKYVPVKDEDGNVEGSTPVVRCTLEARSADEHALADALGDMVGKRVKIVLTLEQLELPEA